jgi:tRNA(Ile)-lysidine synthetase-like protein
VIPTGTRRTVGDYIRARGILRPGPLVVAVSGGPDSIALLLLLADLADEFGLVLHVAHFDHRTRPKQAAQEAEFVARLANRVGAPVRLGRAERPTKSDDARRARYAFLRRAAEQIGATAIATGHTRDDQAETVLLHLARGTGLAGLAGMRPLRDGIARPLLCIGRVETAAVCRASRVRPKADPTNRSLRQARNRVRHRIIPELAKINPRASEAIARFADAAAALGDDQERRVEAALADVTRGELLLLETLADEDLRARVLATAWRRATGHTLSARHRAALVTLTGTHDGSRAIDLPGGRAVREYGVLRIAAVNETPIDPQTRLVPGRETTWNGWRLALGVDGQSQGTHEAQVPKSLIRTVVVRERRPGDRVPSLRGRKLQDIFTDAKVPVALRARWPVVVTSEPGVWWVPGLTKAPPAPGGTRLAVAAPPHMRNELWMPSVRQVASKAEAAAKRPRRGLRT